ncbi:MAG: AarF/UbiB family protein [Mariprofundaceae bacterium]|nr:AarF/UbiB family protein [Mariprofundaceae bacterium]
MLNIFQRGIRLLRMAWAMRRIRKAENKHTQQAARHALSELLAGSRGLPMKVGQFLAGMDDDNAYSKLTTSIDPWPLKHIKPILEQTWGQPLQFILKDIEESHAAASLGQVHRAHLNDKQCVAVKVQYPDIAAAIDAEMKLAGLIPAGGPVKTWNFDLDNYKTTLKNNLNDELDYLHEMKQQLAFASTMHVEGLHIPHVFPVLCRRNILVQEWAEGVRLSEAATWSQPARLYIARTLMQTMFQSLFEFGLVHGDPHPGNMLFQHHDTQPQTTLLDFGCMVHVEQTRRMALLKLILHSRGECDATLFDAFAALGFNAEKLRPIEDKLPQLIKLLFQPFMNDTIFDVTSWHLSDSVANLLGDQRWWFRSAAPADLFLLIRIFQGLATQLETLNIQLAWWPLLKQAIKPNIIEESMHWQAGHKPMKKTVPVYKGSAKELHVHIERQDKDPMHITLSAENALQLEVFMPDHVHEHIRNANIDLTSLREKLIREGLEPQTLIDIKSETYHYHLYLK